MFCGRGMHAHFSSTWSPGIDFASIVTWSFKRNAYTLLIATLLGIDGCPDISKSSRNKLGCTVVVSTEVSPQMNFFHSVQLYQIGNFSFLCIWQNVYWLWFIKAPTVPSRVWCPSPSLPTTAVGIARCKNSWASWDRWIGLSFTPGGQLCLLTWFGTHGLRVLKFRSYQRYLHDIAAMQVHLFMNVAFVWTDFDVWWDDQ